MSRNITDAGLASCFPSGSSLKSLKIGGALALTRLPYANIPHLQRLCVQDCPCFDTDILLDSMQHYKELAIYCSDSTAASKLATWYVDVLANDPRLPVTIHLDERTCLYIMCTDNMEAAQKIVERAVDHKMDHHSFVGTDDLKRLNFLLSHVARIPKQDRGQPYGICTIYHTT